MAFFEYHQNNSGGGFDFDEDRGITHTVIIEAPDAETADYRAEQIGIYFNGCDDDIDCPCCGDRWHSAYGQGTKEPMYYGQPVTEATGWMTWIGDGKDIAVHYGDGRIEWHGIKEKSSG